MATNWKPMGYADASRTLERDGDRESMPLAGNRMPNSERFSVYVYVRNRMCHKSSPYSSTARLVAWTIAGFMGLKPDGRFRCYPGYRHIAENAGIHKDTVRKAVFRELTTGSDPIFELVPGKRGPNVKRIEQSNTYVIPQRYVDAYRRDARRAQTPPIKVLPLPPRRDYDEDAGAFY